VFRRGPSKQVLLLPDLRALKFEARESPRSARVW
jgi:hypothetical protein